MLRQIGIFAAAGVAFVVLAGCAIVDKYADRAVDFNLQAEKTQQQNLLLNIIRASLRRPMQFTGLSSISGNATATGGVTGGYTNAHQTPWLSIFNIVPATTSTSTAISRTVTGTGSGTASLSGGQNFTVPVLDTQEFYQGILKELEIEVIDYYVKQGFPLELLFDLFVLKIEVIATDSCDRFTFRNSVRNQLQFGQFQALVDYLLSSGFTTETVRSNRPYGPPIASTHEPLNASDTAKLVEAYSKASSAGLELQVEKNGISLRKRSSSVRLCFDVSGNNRPTWLNILGSHHHCGQASSPVTTRSAPKCGLSGDDPGVMLSELLLDRIKQAQQAAIAAGNNSVEDYFPINRFRNKHVTFFFTMRSVEGIMYYLGEVTRVHLQPEFGEPSRIIQTKTGLRFGTLPMSDCNSDENGGKRQQKHDLRRLARHHELDKRSYNCENLFLLETGLKPDAFFSVRYDGENYYVPNETDRAGRTLQVLELVKQLLALHTSAKQLPQSSVISIIGGAPQ
jgi:hypothetical protein